MNVEKVLQERGSRYGAFQDHADLCQRLKHQMRRSNKWHNLDSDMAEALEMIQHKIARILNGDPGYSDSWVDIAGYATLVASKLKAMEDGGK